MRACELVGAKFAEELVVTLDARADVLSRGSSARVFVCRYIDGDARELRIELPQAVVQSVASGGRVRVRRGRDALRDRPACLRIPLDL